MYVCILPHLLVLVFEHRAGGGRVVRSRALALVDPWSPVVDNPQQVATQFFALSIFPYTGFLITLTRAKPRVPRVALVGFYFLLAFVFATSE